MSRIILSRHGLTEANLTDRFAGRADIGLTPAGREQVLTLADALVEYSPRLVACGPARRTRESAEIIANHLKVETRVMEEFHEIDLPHWDGLTKAEIRKKFGSQYPTWLATPHLFSVEGCEDLAAVRARALAGLNKLADEWRKGCLVVVSHLIVVRALLTAAHGVGLDRFRSYKMANSEFIVLKRTEDKQGWKI